MWSVVALCLLLVIIITLFVPVLCWLILIISCAEIRGVIHAGKRFVLCQDEWIICDCGRKLILWVGMGAAKMLYSVFILSHGNNSHWCFWGVREYMEMPSYFAMCALPFCFWETGAGYLTRWEWLSNNNLLCLSVYNNRWMEFIPYAMVSLQVELLSFLYFPENLLVDHSGVSTSLFYY